LVPSDESSEQDSKKRKRQIKKKDPDAPKHPMSSYLLFAKDNRASVVEANPTLTPNQIATEMGRIWRELASADKQVTRCT
jgi:hypothetical protein